jgi:hypothetical protein
MVCSQATAEVFGMDYFVTADPSREELLRLWSRNFSGDWENWYQWIVPQNPYGPMSNWLVATEQGAAVGSTGLMERPMKVGDEVRRVGQALHVNVDPEHRSALPAMKLQRAVTAAVQESGLPFVCGVTETAIPVFRRCGYELLGKVARWIKPLRSAYKLKQRIANPLARRLASAAVDLALRARSAETYSWCGTYWRGADKPGCGTELVGDAPGTGLSVPREETVLERRGVRVVVQRQFDERFDRLWEAAAPLLPLIGARTQTYLAWRFVERPKTDCEVFTVSAADDELLGYVVFTRRESTADASYLQICDLFYREETALGALLAEFCRYARRQNVDAVSLHFLGSPVVTQTLRRFGFYERGHRLQALVYVNPRADVDRALVLDPARWHLTDAELDF